MATNNQESMETTPPADGWKLPRAAQFLGLSPRTLERYVARRMVPCIIYPPARVDEADAAGADAVGADAAGASGAATVEASTRGEGKPRKTEKGMKPIVVFDPDELAAWRAKHKVGRSAA